MPRRNRQEDLRSEPAEELSYEAVRYGPRSAGVDEYLPHRMHAAEGRHPYGYAYEEEVRHDRRAPDPRREPPPHASWGGREEEPRRGRTADPHEERRARQRQRYGGYGPADDQGRDGGAAHYADPYGDDGYGQSPYGTRAGGTDWPSHPEEEEWRHDGLRHAREARHPRDLAGGRGPSGEHFDPDYLAWRDRQLAAHDEDYRRWRAEQQRRYDEDYGHWCRERRDRFCREFEDWRRQRSARGDDDAGGERNREGLPGGASQGTRAPLPDKQV